MDDGEDAAVRWIDSDHRAFFMAQRAHGNLADHWIVVRGYIVLGRISVFDDARMAVAHRGRAKCRAPSSDQDEAQNRDRVLGSWGPSHVYMLDADPCRRVSHAQSKEARRGCATKMLRPF